MTTSRWKVAQLLAHNCESTTLDIGIARITGQLRGGRVDAFFGICGADAAPRQGLASAVGITIR